MKTSERIKYKTQVSALSPRAQRNANARMNLQVRVKSDMPRIKQKWDSFKPHEKQIAVAMALGLSVVKSNGVDIFPPEYPTDLEAVREAELVAIEKQPQRYVKAIRFTCGQNENGSIPVDYVARMISADSDSRAFAVWYALA